MVLPVMVIFEVNAELLTAVPGQAADTVCTGPRRHITLPAGPGAIDSYRLLPIAIDCNRVWAGLRRHICSAGTGAPAQAGSRSIYFPE